FIRSTQPTSGSPALPRKQRDKSPSSLLEDAKETTFTRDRKGGFFSSFMKKRNAPTPPKRSSSFREMENQPHKKYELTGLPEQDRMAMTLPRNSQRSKIQLERTVSTSSQPDESTGRANDLLPKRFEEGPALTRERPKAKLLPRGATALPFRTPSGSEEKEGPGLAAAPKGKEKNSGPRQGALEDGERPGWSSPVKAAAILPTTHNHKVPVLISPTLKHTPADVQLIGTDSQGNKFKLLSEHQVTSSGDRDRPRRVKPKCAPPPPPVMRLLQQPAACSDAAEELSNVAGAQHGLESSEGSKKAAAAAPVGGKSGRPVMPPPQVPLSSSSTSPVKIANGTAGAKVALRKTKQAAEKISADKISKEALLECADLLSSAIAEPTPNSQLVDTGHQLLDYCSGYVDCIPHTRNKFAFREAVSKLELSLQELQVSSTAASVPGANPVLNNLLSCVQEISDVVQR
ncbi:PREDICTED: Abelson tyrosine-protein kinase 2-like, partial [Leptosomus discolor]|uniref:Abelson tyrosine-protein kinase 2-like n=1 Tax=Leptosomus discolor TaxID=188344 RepID=UPI000522A433